MCPSSTSTDGTPSATEERSPTEARGLELVSSGLPGLDEILGGGLLAERAYLVRGGPGAGKTILGWHFLSAAEQPDAPLFVTFGEPTDQLVTNAEALGFHTGEVEFLDLSPNSAFFTEHGSYDIFPPSEVERGPATEKIVTLIEEHEPRRIFVDSMTQFRYLASAPEQFRKQSQAFLRFLKEQGATVLLTSESTPEAPDDDLQFGSDGIISLALDDQRRSLAVTKFRGGDFQKGSHSLEIGDAGMTVYPRLAPSLDRDEFDGETISSGVPELDELLDGGLDRGTITIISGPSGAGKTTLGLQFMNEAAGRGERSVLYNFEEENETLIHRCENLNIPVSSMIERGTLSLTHRHPWDFLADRFTRTIRREVEERDAGLIMIDSLTGLEHALGERTLTQYLHTLGKYLVDRNVTFLLINETRKITGEFQATESDISYLADNLLFLRYLEMQGRMRKAIGVLKKRTGDFEKSLREFRITEYGIKVGEPLTGLRDILRGTPEWIDAEESDPIRETRS